jgi:hypothetical protein
MDGVSPWQKLRQLEVPVEFAVLPPIVLDRIATDWVLGPGNDLLTHYRPQLLLDNFHNSCSPACIPHPEVTSVLGEKPTGPYSHTKNVYE